MGHHLWEPPDKTVAVDFQVELGGDDHLSELAKKNELVLFKVCVRSSVTTQENNCI